MTAAIEDNETKPDVMLFIAGIGGGEEVDQSLDGFAKRVMTAMDRSAKTAAAKFRVESLEIRNGDDLRADARRIIRIDGNEEEPVLDLVGLAYEKTLIDSFEERSLAGKGLVVLLTILRNTGATLRALLPGTVGKTWGERLQMFWATTIMALLCMYLLVLGIALLDVARSTVAALGGVLEHLPRPVIEVFASLDALHASSGVIVIAAVMAIVPSATRSTFSNIARNYVCLNSYLTVGDRRGEIVGALEGMIEGLAERGYDKVHLVTYSFGSIVSIDAMFPRDRLPPVRFEIVKTLVTIGCPFDMIRTYWPKYFKDRRCLVGAPARWLNVYSTADVLGSNFRDDGVVGEATHGVQLTTGSAASPPTVENLPFENRAVGLMQHLTLLGLRAHSVYWGRRFVGEVTCFQDVVPRVLEGRRALR